MHSLDPLLKGLILKIAIALLCGLATLFAIPSGILLARKVFRRKPKKTMILGGGLLTLLLFLLFAYAFASAGAFAMYHLVVKPSDEHRCLEAMKTISRESSLWAETHDGRFPADFGFLSNRADARFIVMCQTGTSDQDAARKSYEIVTPSAKAGDTSSVFLRCPIHGHAGYADGTVSAGVRRK